MPMADAVRAIRKRLPDWAKPVAIEDIQPPVIISVVDDIAELVRMARYEGYVDRQSATWGAVSGWASNQLLEIFAAMENADAEKSAELRAHAHILRELLAIGQQEEKIEFIGTPPYIP